jgi:hypothetical protein
MADGGKPNILTSFTIDQAMVKLEAAMTGHR